MRGSLLSRRRPPRQLQARFAPGAYLTDGKRLFRCVPSEDPGAVLLEDCLTLEYIHCYFDEVATMRLVRSAAPVA